MTTIAYRDGVLAADTLASSGGTAEGQVVKIFRKNGILGGASGYWTDALKFRDWVVTGMGADWPDLGDRKDENDHTFGFLYPPSGLEVKFTPRGPCWIRAPFYAHGSGGWIALGAMEMGATAEEAVRAAMKWDHGTGGDVTVLRH